MVYQQYVSKEHVIVGKAVFKREKDRSACSNQFARTILKKCLCQHRKSLRRPYLILTFDLENTELTQPTMHYLLISRFKNIFYVLLAAALTGCQTLTFTEEQFDGIPSNSNIPADWLGDWGSGEDEPFFIHADSIYIRGFGYKFDPEKLDTLDGTVEYTSDEEVEESNRKDKLIFQDNWCFFEVYYPDSSELLSGYRLMIAKKETNGDISCWDVSYSYMLKNQHITAIPAVRLTYSTPENPSKIPVLEEVYTLIQLPAKDKLSKRHYHKIVRQLTISPDMRPLISKGIFGMDFFKEYASKNKADVVLKANRTYTVGTKSRLDKKYERLAQKSALKDLIRTVETDF